MTTAIHAEATKAVKKPAKAKAAPAAKPAVKAATAKKPAKAATKAPSKPRAPKAPAAPTGVNVQVANRPGSGVALFAYTEAVLNALGMYDGKGVEKAKLLRVMGQTAITYHTAQKASMVRGDDGLYRLTVAGVAFFKERSAKASAADVQAWLYVLATGRADGVVCKNQDMLSAI